MLHTLLGLYFADNYLFEWLVNSHLANPEYNTNPDGYDNLFCHAEDKVHALILLQDLWYCYPAENSSELSEVD